MLKIEEQVYELLKLHNITLTTAESATGGLIASTLINVPGISEFFQEGYVTYSNDAKVKMIGVDRALIDKYGVVSKEVAENMAISASKTAGCDAALSVTGVAGPDGGTQDCPVGTVYIGCYFKGNTVVEHHIFAGDRLGVRKAAANRALALLVEQIQNRLA
ncbi:MAG: CinA family protein [Roseburia sp.]|nr:CinA family protein [Roseburia sp.]